MVPTSYQPYFHRLFEQVNARSAQLVEEVITPKNQWALLETRGILYGLQLQADVLRYHLNRNLCRREDMDYLIHSWRGMAARLYREATEKPDAATYLIATATTLREGALFFKEALARGCELQYQLDDDGELEDRRKYG